MPCKISRTIFVFLTTAVLYMQHSSSLVHVSQNISTLQVARLTLLVAAMQAGFAWSQALPQAGQVNKDAQQVLPAPQTGPVIKADPLPAQRSTAPVDVKVLIKGFKFNGNTSLTTEELQALVASSVNQQLDFAALEGLAATVSRYYRSKGFAVARAYLPAQQSADGIIAIQISEGLYGKVNINNSSPISTDRIAQTLANNLCSVEDKKDCVGKHIKEDGLERAVLLVKDLPGVTAAANLKPGVALGTSELDLQVRGTKPNVYSLGFDNFGSIATGTTRLNASADLRNLRGDGDVLSLGFATTTVFNATKTGNVTYSAPVGYQGQRLGVSFSRSQYRLGAGFSAINAYGLSNAVAVFNSYPVIRTVNRSLYFRATGEVRGGYNNVGAVGASFKSNANVVRLGLNGDTVDGFGGGGYTVYSTTLSTGFVGTNDANDSSATGARSAGRFSKLAYSIARQQATVGALTLFGSLSGQQAFKNLDGSEQTGLGGPNSVRGYGGEAGGSTGANATLELRYTSPIKVGDDITNITYGLFVDRGWIRFFETVPTGTAATTANTRALSSYGLTATLQSSPKAQTSTSWGYFLRGMVGYHSMSDLSTVDPTSRRKFWLQGGVNF
jgi:hemolysin activation/secretion protein